MPGTGAGPPLWARPDPPPLVVRISGPIAPADIHAWCEAVRSLLETSGADLVSCDLAALADPDFSTVDALARLTLVARRLGREVRVRDAPPELSGLLRFAGLDGVVPCV